MRSWSRASLCPQKGRRVFPTHTVDENLNLGRIAPEGNTPRDQQQRDASFPCSRILKERNKQLAGTLSAGQQQMLAIGRALMSSPKLLLLDGLRWPGTHPGQPDPRHYPRDQQPGGVHPPGGAERIQGFERCHKGLCTGERSNSSLRTCPHPQIGREVPGGLPGRIALKHSSNTRLLHIALTSCQMLSPLIRNSPLHHPL